VDVLLRADQIKAFGRVNSTMTGKNFSPILSLVMPFFNEEEGIENTLQIIQKELERLSISWEMIAINDGSRDRTLEALIEAQHKYKWLTVVDLSRNFGKEAALSAGLLHARGNAVIPLDADLQDPPELIGKLLDEWRSGAEVVLARRVNRDADSFMKRLSAGLFYRIINKLSHIEIPENVGDFRLMDRVVVNAILTFPENHRFMKGLFSWAGFRTVTVDYVRPSRILGKTKFNGWKLWNLALEGVTSFSTAPLRIWSYLGGSIAFIGIIYALYIIIRTLVHGVDMPGYASLITVVLVLGGLQLIGLGIIGEYLGRVYMESKRRPSFIVRKVIRQASANEQAVSTAKCND